jgi:hypothetical protein
LEGKKGGAGCWYFEWFLGSGIGKKADKEGRVAPERKIERLIFHCFVTALIVYATSNWQIQFIAFS